MVMKPVALLPWSLHSAPLRCISSGTGLLPLGINEAERLAERFEDRVSCANLHRLRGVFLATVGADETQIEASFCAALRIAREQKSIPLVKTAEATYAEYCRQKANTSEGRGFRLPLW